MSNLKKVVSLVLVLVMVFAMGASAMAAFTDAADINFVDEVNLLTALGVLSGYPDGSFQPQGPVTRAEFAKMLFMVKLGHLDSAGFVNAATTFTDLEAAAWAKGFIKYLNSVGVVAGKSATSFDPNGQVTGYEAVKMLLVALGYKADQAGLVGENWKLNTLGLGQDRGILDGYNKDFDAPATRELACLLISNALDAVCVKYSGLSIDGNGNLTTDVIDETRTEYGYTVLMTLGYKAFGLYYETGIVVATKNLALMSDTVPTYYANSAKDAFNLKATSGTGFTKNTVAEIKFADFNEALIGQEVVVAYKIATNGDKVAYGVTSTGKSKVYTSALVDTKDVWDSTDTDFEKLTTKVDGSTKDFKKFETLAATQVVYVNNTGASANAYVDIELFFKGSTIEFDSTPIFGANIRLPGTINLVDSDDNGSVDYAYVIASTFGRVDTYNEADKKFLLAGTANIERKDDDFKKVSGDFKAGDYAFVTPKFNGDLVVTPAEKLNIKVTEKSDGKVYVGDKAYYGYLSSVGLSSFDFESTYTVYTDGTFIAKADLDTTEVTSVDNIALVTYADLNSGQVRLLKANGDVDYVTVTNDVESNFMKAIKAGSTFMVKFSTESNGRVKLSEIKNTGTTAYGFENPKYTRAGETVTYGSETYLLDDSSKIFVKGSDGTGVFSKKDVKDNNTDLAVAITKNTQGGTDFFPSSVIFRTTSNGYKYIVAAFVETASTKPAGATTAKLVFMTKDPSEKLLAGGTFTTIEGFSEGAAVTYTSEADVDFTTPDPKKYNWVEVKLNSDNEITSIAVVDAAAGATRYDIDAGNVGKIVMGAINAFDSTYKDIQFHTSTDTAIAITPQSQKLKVTSDTKYYLLGSGSMTVGSFDSLKRATYTGEGATSKYLTNVFVKYNASFEAEVVIISANDSFTAIDSSINW